MLRAMVPGVPVTLWNVTPRQLQTIRATASRLQREGAGRYRVSKEDKIVKITRI